jgi:hypothetical protein
MNTEQVIKPINTSYKGYNFRSRLEARWAVFFDNIGIKWDYEIEGYNVGDDVGFYLPDFWLPDYGSFLEIKFEYNDEYDNLCEKFNLKINPIFLLCGSPWNYLGFWYGWDTNDSGGGISKFDIVIMKDYILINDISNNRTFYLNSMMTKPVAKNFINIYDLHHSGDRMFENPENHQTFERRNFIWKHKKSWGYKETKYAIDKSKSIRFEFNQ